MPWWGWLLVGLGLAAALAAIAVAFRSQLFFAVKFARTLMSDQRVPRPLRWLIGISLAIKVVPFPDFGVDEVVLIAVGLVLLIFYRPALRAILDETRLAQADEAGSPPS
jgi:membrane protein implicated in regulation of membrane protease activity